mmetsp:Transcript_13049/g.14120  ORF Transcript_13049/g.14120 Transcript_13049/m.14120 type:complete len:438 (+) Transcript_13049:114-1427(+)
MSTTSLFLLLCFFVLLPHQSHSYLFPHTSYFKSLTILQSSSSNVDLFSSSGERSLSSLSKQFLEDQAVLLRKEAEELEISLREEARAKGLPEEMINKLIPIRGKTTTPTTLTTASTATATVQEKSLVQSSQPQVTFKEVKVDELKAKIGYLNVGDAVNFASSLNRLKASGYLRLWDSVDLSSEKYSASVGDLKFKANIEPANLKLDDVGYNYQNVLISAVIIGTVSALLSSAVGGQLGFLLGYISVLFPIIVVGVGSFAPALIGEVLLQIRLKFNEEAKQRYARMNAGKFLVGYIVGLPVQNFYSGDAGNLPEFFQLKPTASSSEESGPKRMFSKSSYAESDVAPCTVASIAGSVAECIELGSASGSNSVDVNLMYELLTSVNPSLPAEKLQAHIRWAAVQAYDILKKNRTVYRRLVTAFLEKRSLEDCIAIIEGKE